ncbi:hypothetical protein [Dyadobacter arcticus]|uniref:Uncharacterized protein n=1 Tax=Dyadobacter arcticus TaxID=1078754 RepID=A0ABX0UFR3_9BACT|nr:hypothetical protein [Dyadobacter arcticus]NIJ51848.1 hypothetical protein [Dyadobacter arcticus]
MQQFIERIENLQSKGNNLFPQGIFPARRVNPLIGYQRPDTTIFFSSIICFTLQSIRKDATAEIQAKIDSICAKVILNYPDFKNKDGLKTYNFWKTKPSKHFPNGFVFRHFDHFRIPDDVDDTAFVYMTTNPSQDELDWLKGKLAVHANGSKKWISNTLPEYKSLKAYSTWFGKNMYVEFDISVLSNLLYCIMHYKLPFNQHDSDSLAYIRSVIETGRYLQSPFRFAHQYPRAPLIIYHVARLIGTFDPEHLRTARVKFVNDIIRLSAVTENRMDRVILASSLIRLGVKTERIEIEKFKTADFKGFYFFIAGLLTAYQNPLLYRLSIHPLFHMHWICEAHCWTLLAEYQTLWNGFENDQSISPSNAF